MEKIALNGIQRLHDGINTDQGTCDELINIRNKDGQWVLMQDKEALYNLTGILNLQYLTLWYKHPVSSENLFIAYDTSANNIVELDGDLQTSGILLGLSSGEACSKIYHFGVFLIIVTDINVYYLRFDPDDSSYTVLPDIEHGIYAFASDMDDKKSVSHDTGEENIDVDGDWEVLFPRVVTSINKLKDDGYFNGHTFFRVAFKTSDGEYILPTTSYYHHVGIHDFDGDTEANDVNNVPGFLASTIKVIARYEFFVKPKIDYSFTQSQLDILDLYKGMITGIAIFMTNPLEDRNYNLEGEDDKDNLDEIVMVSNQWFYPYSLTKNLGDYIKSPGSYYLIKEIDLSELSLTDSLIVDIEGLKDIETKVNLPVDQFTHHKPFSSKVYEYNSRLHYSNVQTKLSGGLNVYTKNNIDTAEQKTLFFPSVYNGGDFVHDSNANPYTWDLYTMVTLKTKDDGVKTVIRKFDTFDVYTHPSYPATTYFVILNQMLSYPDVRAETIVLMGYDSVNDKYHQIGNVYDLIAHTYFNFAYYIADPYTHENTEDALLSVRTYQYLPIQVPTLTTLRTYPEISVVEDRYTFDSNRVQVSEVDTILFFPAENSYRVGRLSNTITGVMSQAVPMSEGQYGFYPLVIFTNEGVFSLEQGEGDILYKSIQPVSLDVVTNPDSIIPIDNGVMFVSEKGLMVLSGRKSTEISEVIEGDPKSDIKTDANYISAIDGSDGVVTLVDSISSVGFKEYLQDAVIAFDHVRDEIVVSNTKAAAGVKTYGYSYIFSIKNNTWYKTSQTFTNFIGTYPGWYGVEGNTMYGMTENVGSTNDWLIKTNPFKFGTNDFKMIEKLAVRMSGEFAQSSGNFLSFYVYGSLNQKEWKLITGIKPDHTSLEISNMLLMLRKIRTTARYFVIFMASGAFSMVHSEFEFNLKLKIPQKVR